MQKSADCPDYRSTTALLNIELHNTLLCFMISSSATFWIFSFQFSASFYAQKSFILMKIVISGNNGRISRRLANQFHMSIETLTTEYYNIKKNRSRRYHQKYWHLLSRNFVVSKVEWRIFEGLWYVLSKIWPIGNVGRSWQKTNVACF